MARSINIDEEINQRINSIPDEFEYPHNKEQQKVIIQIFMVFFESFAGSNKTIIISISMFNYIIANCKILLLDDKTFRNGLKNKAEEFLSDINATKELVTSCNKLIELIGEIDYEENVNIYGEDVKEPCCD